ncbi:MAG: hypothetical protein ABI459_03420 [Deltaproteobacteria bacterium]
MSTLDRNEVEALLVFLANGTLEGDERAAVEAAVAADVGLQQVLAALTNIRTQMQSEDLSHSPGEFGLARLMRDVGREPVVQAPSRVRLWQGLAAAAIAVAVVQFAFVNSSGTIRLAGGGTEVASGPTLQVAFKADATEGAIRQLLLDLDLTIVAGPSALGLYTVAAKDEAARDAAVTELSRAAIVESAEAVE